MMEKELLYENITKMSLKMRPLPGRCKGKHRYWVYGYIKKAAAAICLLYLKMCNFVLSRWSVAATTRGKQGNTSMNGVTNKIPSDTTGVRSRKIQQCWIFKRTSVLSDDKRYTCN